MRTVPSDAGWIWPPAIASSRSAVRSGVCKHTVEESLLQAPVSRVNSGIATAAKDRGRHYGESRDRPGSNCWVGITEREARKSFYARRRYAANKSIASQRIGSD